MKKSILLLLVPSLLIAGCNTSSGSKRKSNSSTYSESSISSTSDDASSSNPVSGGSSISSTAATSGTSKTTTSPSSSSKTSSTTQSDDPYFDGKVKLPTGNYQCDKPTNSPIQIVTSNDSSDWWQEDIQKELPSDMAFIYGNNSSDGPSGHYAGPTMYQNEAGGLKISKETQGIRSPLFTHSGEKLEIRIGISQLANASGTPDKNKDTGYIYFFNSNGDFLSSKTVTVEENSIDSTTQYLRYYVLGAQQIAYFEFRLNVKPYKNSQNYNFGIGYLAVHSWPQA